MLSTQGLFQTASLLLGVVLVCSSVGLAQNTVNGTITGTVKDSSGAVVVDAAVTVTNTASQVSQSTRTNPSGIYLFSDLIPGTYNVDVEKTGFRHCQGTGIVLDPGLTRTFSCNMDVGAVTEVVSVQAGALQVDTATSKVNGVINSEQVQELPVNGRNFTNFLALEPGVAGINFGDFNSMNIFATQGVSVNGLRDQDNNILVDGVTSQRTRDNAATTAAPPIDAIGEINIVSAGYMPEYSRGAGAQIITQLKSGTSQWHGSLYEYNQNTVYDSAANAAPNLVGSTRGPINWNNFGGTVGGPIPKVRKLFFFFSEDVTREPASTVNNVVVPSALAQQGNFSEYCAAGIGCPVVPAFLNGKVDPNTGETLVAGKPFPNDTIAQAFWSANGAALMHVYPLPNVSTGTVANGLTNYRYVSSNPSNNHTETARVDYSLDRINSHLAVSLRHYDTDQYSGNFGGSPQLLDWEIQQPERGASVDFATTFSPTVFNDLVIGSTEDIVHVVVPPGVRGNGTDRSAFGITFPYIFGDASKDISGKTPTITWGGVDSNIDSFNPDTDAYPSSSVGHIYQFSDSITKIRGNHTLKFGAWIEKDGERDSDQLVIGAQNLNGQMSLAATNNPFSTGLPLADLMLGVVDNYSELGYRNTTPWIAWQQGYFVQDSWKATHRLTIEGGLRWDYFPQYSSSWCNFSMFNSLAYSTIAGVKQVIDPATGFVEGGNYYNGISSPCSQLPASGYEHFGVFGQGYNASTASLINQQLVASGILRGYSPSIVQNRYRNFQPRLGFAWDPFGKGTTAIRGSAGIFYNHDTLSDQTQMGRNVPFQTNAVVTNIDVDCPGVAQNPSDPASFGCAGGKSTFSPGLITPSPTNEQPPIPISGEDPKGLIPEVFSYHLGIQHMLHKNILLDIGYVGTQARHLSLLEDLNQLPVGTYGDCTLAGGAVSATNPAACAAGSPYKYNNGATAGVATQIQTLVPYPGFTNAIPTAGFTYQMDGGTSGYNALQITAQRRLTNNLMFTMAYTYANAYDYGSELQSSIVDIYDLNYSRGIPDWLAHHTLTATYLYDLPFFTDHNTLAGRVLGGWELTGVVTIRSGQPYDPYNSTYFTPTDQGTDIAGMGADNNERISVLPGCNPNSGPRTYSEFIDTSCFAVPTAGTLGNLGRNTIFGPRFWIWNASLHKNGNLVGEKVKYEFRCEAVNVLNHPIPNSINSDIFSPTFGQINAVYTAGNPSGNQRALQLGLRLFF
jgi:Carboxypeptidase regulatory-like domain/TonB-dependent Receptor Plug Domain